MSIISKIGNRASKSLRFINKIIRDEVVLEVEIPTIVGRNFFYCQKRSTAEKGQYLVFKVKGGDATVWVGFDQKSAKQIIAFIEENIISMDGVDK
ncbi:MULTISPECIES: hypothetical protein [unclassified Phyllobacterium]|uniref:hypothetical protein n=1 Tax=unclassified Phyllobacterium TaxID=2638441 RepID=UPI003012CC1C